MSQATAPGGDATPLAGLGVLITRARHQVQALVARLETLGASVHVHPVIEIVPPEDARPLHEAVGRLHEHDWVVFTSANAVEAVLGAATGGWSAGRCRVAVVGAATERALAARGIGADLVPPEFTAESLALALVERHGGSLDGCTVLFPRAREGRDALPRILEEHGARVVLVEAYRTVPCVGEREPLQDCLRHGRIQVLTFASPSAVRAFDDLAGDPRVRALDCVCIGPVTAQAARTLGYCVRAVPGEHTADGMANALLACQSRAGGHLAG